jgi:mannitol/fructose-specific phosphotransferase system IIA component (Ntr-type)
LYQELLTSQSLDGGSAVPQVKLAGVEHPRFVLGRSAGPLYWRASFYPPIEFVFLIIKPVKVKEGDESRLLSIALTALGGNPAQLEQLRAAPSAEEMLAVLAHCRVSASEPLVKA